MYFECNFSPLDNPTNETPRKQIVIYFPFVLTLFIRIATVFSFFGGSLELWDGQIGFIFLGVGCTYSNIRVLLSTYYYSILFFATWSVTAKWTLIWWMGHWQMGFMLEHNWPQPRNTHMSPFNHPHHQWCAGSMKDRLALIHLSVFPLFFHYIHVSIKCTWYGWPDIRKERNEEKKKDWKSLSFFGCAWAIQQS
jgi:hypothetical protein